MPTFESATGRSLESAEGAGPYPGAPYPASVIPPIDMSASHRTDDSLSLASYHVAEMPRAGVYVNQIAERFDRRGAPNYIEDVDHYHYGSRRDRKSKYDEGEDQLPFFYRTSKRLLGDFDHFVAEFQQYTQEYESTKNFLICTTLITKTCPSYPHRLVILSQKFYVTNYGILK